MCFLSFRSSRNPFDSDAEATLQATPCQDKRKKEKKRKTSNKAKPEKAKKKAPVATQCDLSDDSETEIARFPTRKQHSVFSDSEVSLKHRKSFQVR